MVRRRLSPEVPASAVTFLPFNSTLNIQKCHCLAHMIVSIKESQSTLSRKSVLLGPIMDRELGHKTRICPWPCSWDSGFGACRPGLMQENTDIKKKKQHNETTKTTPSSPKKPLPTAIPHSEFAWRSIQVDGRSAQTSLL